MPPRARTIRPICSKCGRVIHIARVDGARVELDPELLSVVPLSGGLALTARRVHSERCAEYQEQERRDRIAKERLEFESARAGS